MLNNFKAIAKTVLILALSFGFSLTAFTQEESFHSIGKHENKKARVQFDLKNDGKIVAYLHEYNADGSYPKSGYIVCEDLSAFPVEEIENEVKKKFYAFRTFIIDYEVIEESKSPVLSYTGKVTKAVPFQG